MCYALRYALVLCMVSLGMIKQGRSSVRSYSIVGGGGSGLTLFGEALSESEVFKVLCLPGLLDGVVYALISTRRNSRKARRLPPMARAMIAIMYHAAISSATISRIDILRMVDQWRFLIGGIGVCALRGVNKKETEGRRVRQKVSVH